MIDELKAGCAGREQVVHTVTATRDALEWVRELCGVPAAAIDVGIELRDGPLVETCLDDELPVFEINLKQKDGSAAGLRRPTPKTFLAMRS